MIDVQSSEPDSKININKVGVKNLRYPLIVLDKEKGKQRTVAKISLYVDLPKRYKGTHMSRFIEIIDEYTEKVLTVDILNKLVKEVRKRLGSQKVYLEISFPYFLRKESPISKKKSFLNYTCKIIRSLDNCKVKHYTEVKVPITSLCPCSKEISTRGAHSQRGHVTLRVLLDEFIWIEDLVKLIEEESSCEVYSLLKREDEKYVTEKAYSNPSFVEDIVRKIAKKIKNDQRIISFKVECENQESIHNHNAYACIES